MCECLCAGEGEVAYKASPLQWSAKSAISHVTGSVHPCSAQWDMTLSAPSRPLLDRALISLLASLTNQWEGAHPQHSSKPAKWSSWIYPIMQQKPRGAALAFGREEKGAGVGRCDVHSAPSASRPDRAWSSAETAADPAGANNCFLSAGISAGSGEDKLTAGWGHDTLTRLQTTTCVQCPTNNSNSQQDAPSVQTLQGHRPC